MLAVLRDGFGDSSTAAAPALRMTGGVCGWSGGFEWVRVYSSAFGCVRLRKREPLPYDGACLGESGRWGENNPSVCVADSSLYTRAP